MIIRPNYPRGFSAQVRGNKTGPGTPRVIDPSRFHMFFRGRRETQVKPRTPSLSIINNINISYSDQGVETLDVALMDVFSLR